MTLCWSCKAVAAAALVDDLGRALCAACCTGPAVSPEALGLAYLQATIPYKRGDRVRATTGGSMYDGVGTVVDVSEELRHGGSPVYPSFLVRIDEPGNPDAPAEGWYTEPCLEPAEAK
jgi:hypothetical protein